MICQEENFYKPLETDDIEEKPEVAEHIAEVALSPEIPVKNEVEDYNVKAALVDAMDKVINEYASNKTELHDTNDKVLNCESSITNRNKVFQRIQEKLRSDNMSTDRCVHCDNSNEEANMFLENQHSEEYYDAQEVNNKVINDGRKKCLKSYRQCLQKG